jgi:uncharacterized membrane protein YtjA (UPF0391 family)
MVRFAVVLCVLSAGARLLGFEDIAVYAALAAAALFVLATIIFGIVLLLVSVGGAVTGPSRYWLPDP